MNRRASLLPFLLIGILLVPTALSGSAAGDGLVAGSAPASGAAPLPSIDLALGTVASPGVAVSPRPIPVPRAPGAEELAGYVSALTAPEMEGRGSGTAGGDRAARYLADRLAATGLRPGGDGGTFLQWFGVGSVARAAAGTVLERLAPAPADTHPGSRLDAPWRLAHRRGRRRGGLRRPRSGGARWGSRRYAGVDLKGKIALALEGGAPGPSRLDQLIAARRHGAVALLIAGDTLPSLEVTGTTVKLVSGSVTRLTADVLLAPGGQTLSRLASTRGSGPIPTGVKLRIRVNLDREQRRTANVIGILPGTDPALASEAIVLGAHYDHLGRAGGAVHPGADDNASGTAVVLGLARAFAAAGGSARTLVVALFSGEEIGLLGSAHYVKEPAVPIERTVAMLNFDMVGRMRNDRLTVGGIESGANLRALLAQATSGDRLDLVLHDSPYGPSDHTSFYSAGVPVLFFHTGAHGDYHTPGDTADKLNVAGMAEVARVSLNIAGRLGGDARPAYVKLSPPAAGSRRSGERGVSSGGAFLGVSVDGRSESDGVRLGSVISGSAAERAGLRSGDVIVRLGDHALNRFEDLRRALAERRPGDAVTLVYLRAGEDGKATATLGVRP